MKAIAPKFLTNEYFINNEGDFPNQTDNTITIPSGSFIRLGENVTTSKRFILGDNVLFRWSSQYPTLTYTGTGDMFTGVNVDAAFINCNLSAPNASQVFNFSDTSSQKVVEMTGVNLSGSINKWGTFTDLLSTLINFSSAQDIDDGVTLGGTTGTILDIDKLFMVSSNSSFTGLDLGNVVLPIIQIRAFQCVAPSGGVGISGLANSANVVEDTIAAIVDCGFLGGMDALENISNTDIRWEMRDNDNLNNTQKALNIFLATARTVTISSSGEFVPIGGTNWANSVISKFSSTNAGLSTFLSERQSNAFIIATATVEKSGGGSDTICMRIAINGITLAKTESCTDNQTPTSIVSQAVVLLSEGDTIQLYVANQDTTGNIIVSNASLSITI